MILSRSKFNVIDQINNKRVISLITVAVGSLLVVCWTLFRFYTKSVNFDQTGQQLLARQWFDGFVGGSMIGPTNYIVKMLFLYIPAEAVGINPKLFLIISTIILNIATLIGIYYFSKKILEFFSVPVSTVFNLLILWLSTIIGSVFWIQFTNSRNLEVVAGLAIIYLGLRTYSQSHLPTQNHTIPAKISSPLVDVTTVTSPPVEPILARNRAILPGERDREQVLWAYKNIDFKKVIGLIVLSSITFFADPMQLFVTAMILLAYIAVDNLFIRPPDETTSPIEPIPASLDHERAQSDRQKRTSGTLTETARTKAGIWAGWSRRIGEVISSGGLYKKCRKNAVIILAIIILSYTISVLFKIVASRITGVVFLNAGSLDQSLTVLLQPVAILRETAKNLIRIVAGTNEMGVWRQILNIGLVLFMVISFFSLIIRKIITKKFMLFSIISLIVPIAVYVASGQPIFNTDTSRYLIMIVPMMIISFSALEMYEIKYKKIIIVIISIVIIVNGISLIYATFRSRRVDLVGEYALKNRYEYLIDKNYKYGYSSMDTAIPATYLFGNNNNVLLPLSCENNRLRKATLFYDKSVFEQNEKMIGEVPIILDGQSIANYPSICSLDVIKTQIGDPLGQDETLNGDEVLIYKSDVFKKISF